jgi:hypothetical protein
MRGLTYTALIMVACWSILMAEYLWFLKTGSHPNR